jgi:parallel beta-helix repeat protein
MFAIENDGIDSIFERNTLVGGGIGAYGPGARVLGNRVTAAVEEGIYVFGTASVERNQVRGAAAEGIAVVGDGTAVVGNTTTGTGGAGLLVAASNCRVSKNRMTGLGDVGFVVDGTGNLVTENRVSGSVALDLADTAAEGANTYVGNRFRTVDFDYVL